MSVEPFRALKRAVFVAMVMSLFAPLCAFADTPTQEKRIAVVIGNGAYPSDALATAANDAGLIAQTLQAAGFDVVGARDLDGATLRATLREFSDKAAASGPDTVAMVYFAGYGVQFEGENYLVPIDARMTRDADVPIEGVRVSDFTKSLAALPIKARIIVLDAARIHHFGEAKHPLSGGLALVKPDAGTLVAFNAAPGTVSPVETGPYGSYASALSEMIKVGGLSLNDVFDRTRLRVADLTKGVQLPWQQSRIEAPFVFLERTADAPTTEADRFADLKLKPLNDFSAADAYHAALARDTLEAYQEFLSAYPKDPLAKRVRAIIAARREAATWQESTVVDTPDAYWSYLRRYPNGPHAYEAQQRLSYYNAPYDPPSRFSELPYDVAPPFADELFYVDRRPYVYFGDPVFDLIVPPVLSLLFMSRRPSYFYDMRPPPRPFALFMLPTPDYYPVPQWVEQPRYIAPPPPSAVAVNIHNTIIVNPATNVPVVTTPTGAVVPLVAPTAPPAAPATTGQPVAGQAPVAPATGGAIAPVTAAPVLGVAIPRAAARRLPAGTAPVPVAPSVPAVTPPVGAAPVGAAPLVTKPSPALPTVVTPTPGSAPQPALTPNASPTIAAPSKAAPSQVLPVVPTTPKSGTAPLAPNAASPAPVAPAPSGAPALTAPAPTQPAARPRRGGNRPLPLPQAPATTTTPSPSTPSTAPTSPAPATPQVQAPRPQAPRLQAPRPAAPVQSAPVSPPPQTVAPLVAPPAVPAAPAAPAPRVREPKKPLACGHPGEPACP